jgi:hypothetical protein
MSASLNVDSDAAADVCPPVRQWAGADGPAVPHGSRVKARLTLSDGQAVDRLPAWVRRAVAPPGQMGARFDGVHWAPPQHERHAWCVVWLHRSTLNCAAVFVT